MIYLVVVVFVVVAVFVLAVVIVVVVVVLNRPAGRESNTCLLKRTDNGHVFPENTQNVILT